MAYFRTPHGYSACMAIGSGSWFCEWADGRTTVYPSFYQGSVEFHPIDEFEESANGVIIRCQRYGSTDPFEFPPEGVSFNVHHVSPLDRSDCQVPQVTPRVLAPSPGVYVNVTTQQFHRGEFQNTHRVYPVVKMPERELRFYAARETVPTRHAGDKFFYDAYGATLRYEDGHLAPVSTDIPFTIPNYDPINVQRSQGGRSNWLNIEGLDKAGFEAGLGGRGRTSTRLGQGMPGALVHEPYERQETLTATTPLAHTQSIASLGESFTQDPVQGGLQHDYYAPEPRGRYGSADMWNRIAPGGVLNVPITPTGAGGPAAPAATASANPQQNYSAYSKYGRNRAMSSLDPIPEEDAPMFDQANEAFRENFFDETPQPLAEWTKLCLEKRALRERQSYIDAGLRPPYHPLLGKPPIMVNVGGRWMMIGMATESESPPAMPATPATPASPTGARPKTRRMVTSSSLQHLQPGPSGQGLGYPPLTGPQGSMGPPPTQGLMGTTPPANTRRRRRKSSDDSECSIQ